MKQLKILLILIMLGGIFFIAICTENDITCIHAEDKNISLRFEKANYILHNVSGYSFLSNLKTLTWFKGYYFNIDKEGKAFYQYKFLTRNADTIDVLTENKMELDFVPVDFCINDSGLYILTEEREATLFKYSLTVNNAQFTINEKMPSVIQRNVFDCPNARIEVTSNKLLTARVGVFNDEDEEKYFEDYDLQSHKSVNAYYRSEFIDSKVYFPSMENPYRIDRGMLSMVSFGFEDDIKLFNRRTGQTEKTYCAKSEYISSVQGLAPDEISDIQKPINYLIGNAHYLDLIPDLKNNYYYRIAKHAQKVKDEKTLKLNKIENAPWSLVILNTGLNVVGETYIKPRTLNFLYYFSDNNGVHFLTLNKNSNENSDSILQFAGLEIE